ncbi:MAG: LemA family protein [Emergencia timonensis]|uniref:LemA family protein n=1 Tax=Emergencia timonensis TaxID=1776384 RepID=UPI000833B087|nr:LemA family protein [Emergencia timonensis]WNX87603.1 LemA family protein [Emergencia timonensis]
MIAGIIIAAVVAILVIWVIASYNGFIKAKNNVEESFSTMDVYLKKRYDLIPNLVETVKGYAKHETETLNKVISARNMAEGAATMEDKIQGENMLTGTLRSLFAVAENYPDLKANENFMDLQGQLRQVEEDIANARKYYNAVVKLYNNKCEMFPTNILAGLFHFDQKPMFEVETKAERQNVKVEF